MKKKISFVHLYNDYSGSPLILSTVIKGMQKKGFTCKIITCAEQEGFLSGLEGCEYDYFTYRWHRNPYVRLILYLWSQLVLFFKILKSSKENDVIYINTMLPFGAAIAGKLTGKRVIYHIHETSIKPRLLKKFLKWVIANFSDQTIFVSDFLHKEGNIPKVKSAIVYNALSENFIKNAELQHLPGEKPKTPFTVLMLCSLKDYKGPKEFVKIAENLRHIQFKLVINAEQAAINNYFSGISIPENLLIYPKQSNVHPFYQKAHLVANLSHPEQWIETFGMTLLEGMHYGLPCIAPPVGGPAEIVDHNFDGFLIDQRRLNKVTDCIKRLHQNPDLYRFISNNAKQKAAQFRAGKMIDQLYTLIKN